jgi:hypothetical protein
VFLIATTYRRGQSQAMASGTLAFVLLVMAATLLAAWGLDSPGEARVRPFVQRGRRARRPARGLVLIVVAAAIAGVVAWITRG